MRRVFGWTLIGGLLLATASSAWAQVTVTFGNPYPGTGMTPGSAYGNPSYGSAGAYAPDANTATGYGSAYSSAPNSGYNSNYTYPAQGYNSGYTYPTQGYNSGYAYPAQGYNSGYAYPAQGYAYPGTTSYSYRSYSSGYGPMSRYPSYGYTSARYAYPSYGSRRVPSWIRIR